MSFVYPLGLLGLIGIPILIIIYIIKNKYTEQIVTSTYLWHLSEKFLKKRKQVKLVSGIISLILQIIAVTTISLLVAQPIITLPNVAKEYCFILDASGSMNMEVNNTTKLEIGKDKIEEVILSTTNGSKFTLVYAGATPRVVYEKLEDKEKAVEHLNGLQASGSTISYKNVLSYVQDYFNTNPSLVTYLITDRDYNSSNIEVINVSNHEENYALSDVNYIVVGNKLKLDGNVISYEKDANINLDVYIDEVLKKEDVITVRKQEKTAFSYEFSDIDFDSIKVIIRNEDGLSVDNMEIFYNVEKEHDYSTLIVSDRPFYLYSAIETLGNSDITVIKTENYDPSISGYSLYVFDAFSPSELPKDGTIWIFGAEESITGSGFSAQSVIENESGIELDYPKNSTTTFKTLTNGLTREKIYVSKYVKYGLYRNFTTLLTCEGNPAVFTGLSDNGNREVVFAFDLHNSNLTLLMDYLVMIKNLLDFSFPIIISESNYTCGDVAIVNILSDFDSVRVESPNGNISYLDVNVELAEVELTEAGIYTLTIMSGDESKVFSLYVGLPEEESNTSHEIVDFSLQGIKGNDFIDGKYDKLIILFIIIAVIFMTDWVVYCYEQYQLR